MYAKAVVQSFYGTSCNSDELLPLIDGSLIHFADSELPFLSPVLMAGNKGLHRIVNDLKIVADKYNISYGHM